MKISQIVFVLAVLNYLLWLILHTASQSLTSWNVAIHPDILFIIFPAFFLGPTPGLLLCLFFAFVLGAYRPVPLGATLVTFCLLWQVGLLMRSRLQPQNSGHVAAFAAPVQFLAILLWSLSLSGSSFNIGGYWLRALVEASLSAVVVALLAGWWCRFQERFLADLGWQPEKL